ncbi:MAG: hypothetical protein JW867_06130, partial [Candidatus Omnitrophica bacterium]|nr:hypothetical protein [Candidatus Omnitrophota bacterium]
MSIKRYSIFICFFSCFFLLSPSYLVLAGSDGLSKKHQKEELAFIKKQLTEEDKAFLKDLVSIKDEFKKINKLAIDLYLPISTKEYSCSKTIQLIKSSSRRSFKKISCSKCPGIKIKEFLEKQTPQDSSSLLALDSLINSYAKSRNLEDLISNNNKLNTSSGGAYHYLKIRLKLFEQTVNEDLESIFASSSDSFDLLSEQAKNYKIQDMKSLLMQELTFNQQAKKMLREVIITPMQSSNLTYTNAALLAALELLEKHLQVNENILLALSERLYSIPTPRKPHFADISATEILFNLPKKIKIGSKIQLLITIENLGELTSEASKTKIIFPDESFTVRSVPKLGLQEEYKFKINYRVKNPGNNNFSVVANFDHKALEADFTNNLAEKTLLVEK